MQVHWKLGICASFIIGFPLIGATVALAKVEIGEFVSSQKIHYQLLDGDKALVSCGKNSELSESVRIIHMGNSQNGNIKDGNDALLLPHWVNIMTEDFESSFPRYAWSRRDVGHTGNPTGHLWGKDDYNPHSGKYSAWCCRDGVNGLDPEFDDYANNVLTFMIWGPCDLSVGNVTDAELHFYYWCRTMYEADMFSRLASIDGTNFSGYAAYGDGGDVWRFENFDLTNVPDIGNVCGHPQVWIAFAFESDGTQTHKGAFVDDVILRIRTENYYWPLSRNTTPLHSLTSPFGPRILISGNDTTFDWHGGLDIDDDDNPATEDDVYAVFTGVVDHIGSQSVRIRDAVIPNQRMEYVHVNPSVNFGDSVFAGLTRIGGIRHIGLDHLHAEDYLGGTAFSYLRNPMNVLPHTDTENMTIWGVSSHSPRASFWVTVPGNELDLNRVRVYGSGTGGWSYDKYVDYDDQHNCGDDNPTHNGITIHPTDFGGYPPNDQVTGFTFSYEDPMDEVWDSTITIEVYNIWGVMEASYSVEVFVEPNEDEKLPKEFFVAQNFPNPFNPETEIGYELPMDAQVSLVVYNLLGQKVKTLVDERQRAGRYNICWGGRDDNGQEVASGVYFYKIQAGDVKVAKKMALLK